VPAASILVAGIGNVFLADDGFGVEVARLLAQRELPAGVEVADFGIRGMDLAYELQEDSRRGDPGRPFPPRSAARTALCHRADLAQAEACPTRKHDGSRARARAAKVLRLPARARPGGRLRAGIQRGAGRQTSFASTQPGVKAASSSVELDESVLADCSNPREPKPRTEDDS
jgi:hypothetical protein